VSTGGDGSGAARIDSSDAKGFRAFRSGLGLALGMLYGKARVDAFRARGCRFRTLPNLT
jgi:hypothetical protein